MVYRLFYQYILLVYGLFLQDFVCIWRNDEIMNKKGKEGGMTVIVQVVCCCDVQSVNANQSACAA